ncbi:Regulator of telomere elongation helicase 1 [Nymphon striatum]|nr:Regulator of telomere elongation helicase 1 [Nymphon striatum]
MNITDIHGISVSFPFKPYKVQIDYMKQLIKCLQEGVNGILESPTGTGKTLCLLCASLAWLETKKAAFQAVRQGVGNTDSSQLFGSQLADKLGKAAGKNWDSDSGEVVCYVFFFNFCYIIFSLFLYKKKKKFTVYLARKKKEGIIFTMCGGIFDSYYYYHQRVPKIIYCSRTHSQLSQAMSELKKTSYNHMKATIIASRDQLCIHPEVKKEENSTVKRQMCMSKPMMSVLWKKDKFVTLKIWYHLETNISMNCCPYFTARELKNNADIIFMPYNYLLDSKARKRHGIEMKNCVVIFDEAHNIASVCENSSSVQLKSQDLATAISEILPFKFVKFFKNIINAISFLRELQKNHRLYSNLYRSIYIRTLKRSQKNMEDLVHQEVRSIILTSGTLTPLDTFAQELGISFPVQLENPHVVESNQIWSGVVHSGPDRVTLNSTFKNRNSKEYLYSLGRSIMNISRIVPGGVLVFFPSYKVMEDSVQSWQANDVWNKLNDFKKVFVEPRSQVALNSCMALYYEAIDTQDSKGAIFFAVCRGKVSEGLDFANNYGRAVIITGLPFPPLVDQRVCLKKQYLDGQSKKSSHKSLTGDYWYKMEATRAVNQAIGRVIRHNKDYGAVIFCDERFDYASSRAFLPKWLSSKVRTYKDFGSVIRTLVPFYRNLKSLQIANPSENISQSLKNSSSRSTIETLDEQIGAGSCLNSPKKQHLVIADLKRSYESNNILSSYDNDKANSQKRKSLFESIYDDENKVLSSEFPNKDPIANDTALCKLQAKRKFRVVSNSTVKDSNFCITSDEPSSSKQNSSIQTSSSSVASTNKDNSTMPSQKMLCAKSYMIKMMEGKGYQGAKVTDTRVGWRCLKEFMGSQMRMKQVKSIINEDSSRFAAGKEVKSEINSENFKEFTKIIQKYRTSGEFNSLVSGLASIFTEKESLHELFLNFTMFVKPCHKDEFSKVCFNLTGNEARVSKTV